MSIKLAAAAACGVVFVSALGAQAPDVATYDRWYEAVRGTGPRLQGLLIQQPNPNLIDEWANSDPMPSARKT